MPIFVVALKASSAVRLAQDHAVALTDVPTNLGPVTVTWKSRYSSEGFEAPIPRELWVDVRGEAPDLDAARAEFVEAARVLTPSIALAANAAVDDPELVLAFDDTPGATHRPFLQALKPLEHGFPRSSRLLDGALVAPVATAIYHHSETPRLHRAVVHYGEALKAWKPGQQLRAMLHLWIAVEAMTKAALRLEMARSGVDSEASLASLWEVTLKELDSEIRRRIIFHHDPIFAVANRISNAIEHSFEDFPSVQQEAEQAKLLVAQHVRRSILEQAGVELSTVATLASAPYDEPRESFELTRFLRGAIVGEGDELADDEHAYPWLEWASKLVKVVAEGQGIGVTPEETITVRLRAGLAFKRESFELWGPKQDSASFTPKEGS